MKSSIKRKHFLLPQDLINEVKKVYQAKTETEAIVFSMEEVMKRRKIEELIALPGKINFDMTQKDLRRLRGK